MGDMTGNDDGLSGTVTDAETFVRKVEEVSKRVSEGKVPKTIVKHNALDITREVLWKEAWRAECVRQMLGTKKIDCDCYMAYPRGDRDGKPLAYIPIAMLKDVKGIPTKYVWIGNESKGTCCSDCFGSIMISVTEKLGLDDVEIQEYRIIPRMGEPFVLKGCGVYDSSYDRKIIGLYNSLKNHGRRKTGTIIETGDFMISKYGNDASFSNYIHRTLTAEGIECHCYFLSNHSYDGNARYVVVASSPYETFDWIELAHRKEMGIRRFNDSDTMFNAMAKLFGIPDMEHYEYIPHKGSKFTNATEQPIVPSICKAGEIG